MHPHQFPASVTRFFSGKRIAVVGASRDPKEFSRSVCDALRDRGYEVIAVNKNGGVGSYPTVASLADVSPAADGVLVMLPRAAMAGVVEEAARCGIGRVWLFGTSGAKSAPRDAIEAALHGGMDVVTGFCPMMFLQPVSFIHRFHRGIVSITGGFRNQPAAA